MKNREIEKIKRRKLSEGEKLSLQFTASQSKFMVGSLPYEGIEHQLSDFYKTSIDFQNTSLFGRTNLRTTRRSDQMVEHANSQPRLSSNSNNPPTNSPLKSHNLTLTTCNSSIEHEVVRKNDAKSSTHSASNLDPEAYCQVTDKPQNNALMLSGNEENSEFQGITRNMCKAETEWMIQDSPTSYEQPQTKVLDWKESDNNTSNQFWNVANENQICIVSQTAQPPNDLNYDSLQQLNNILSNLVESNESVVKALLLTNLGNFGKMDIEKYKIVDFKKEIMEAAKHYSIMFINVVQSILNLPIPFVFGMDQPIFDFSVFFLLLADVIYVSDKSSLSLECIRIPGIKMHPGVFLYDLLQDCLGPSMTRSLFLLGSSVSPNELFQKGICVSVLPHSEFLQSIRKEILKNTEFTDSSSQNIKHAKRVLNSYRKRKFKPNAIFDTSYQFLSYILSKKEDFLLPSFSNPH